MNRTIRTSPAFRDFYGMEEAIEWIVSFFRQAVQGLDLMSLWALKRLDEFNGDISRFKVIKVRPSRLRQIAIAKTEQGDENNQDISSLIGKVDIRCLEILSRAALTLTRTRAV